MARRLANGTQESHHDHQFWREVVRARFTVTPQQPILPLTEELSGYLGSPDHELRDELAYTILDVWIIYQTN
jgi:hypothetical protein